MVDTFTKEERAAMRALAKERKANETRAESLATCLARIESMHPSDRELAMQVHNLVLSVNPEFEVKTWYGMPGYFWNGKIILFFQDGHKFKVRYCTLGFQQDAALDEGNFWPTSFALTKLDKDTEKQIVALIKRAIGQA